MKIEEKEITIKQIERKYIADDGEEFYTERDCKKHEEQLEFEKSLEEVKSFMIYEDNYVPCDGECNMKNHMYRWFKVENQRQLDIINAIYQTYLQIKNFPEYVNIEQYNETDYDCSATTLTKCKEYVTKFFTEGFGITVKFE